MSDTLLIITCGGICSVLGVVVALLFDSIRKNKTRKDNFEPVPELLLNLSPHTLCECTHSLGVHQDTFCLDDCPCGCGNRCECSGFKEVLPPVVTPLSPQYRDSLLNLKSELEQLSKEKP